MKLMVAPYNNGAGTWTEAEETAFLSYTIQHRFNAPAEAKIILSDPTGAIARKYNVDANDVFVGAGKVTIEDPTATDIFFGRIMRAEADTESRTVMLYCEDWLSQLNEEQITYDMREKLNGNTRASVIKSDYENTDGHGIGPANKVIDSAQADDGGAFTDETIAANNLTTNDMTLLPAVPAVNDAYYFGFAVPIYTMKVYVSTTGNWVGTCNWEYWNGGAWTSCGYIPGNEHNFETGGLVTYTWTAPSWATCAVNGTTLYWIRARVATYTGITTQPKGAYAYAKYVVYDHQIELTADAHNGMYLVLGAGMAGDHSWRTGPYAETVTPSAAPMLVDLFVGVNPDDIQDLWSEDTDYHSLSDTADWTVDYSFKSWVPDSDFFVSCSGARVHIQYGEAGDSFDISMELYNGGGYDSIGRVIGDALSTRFEKTIEVPAHLLATMFDADGVVKVRLNCAEATGGTIRVYYIHVEIDTSTEGYSTPIAITDGETYRLTVGTDLSADATKVWDGVPYAIAQPIYKHIDSEETPGTLITDGDIMEALTCAATIEHTSGISTRQYKDKTRLQILQDLAQQDKAELWLPLASTTVSYKSTWNDGAPTALTDTDVLSWRSVFDYTKLANEFNIYGVRVGDTELFSNVTDATSIAKYKATRSQTRKGVGLVSEADTLAYGTALVAQYKDVQQILTATIRGNTATAAHPKTIVLGDEISITSTYLGLTASVYIIQSWAYDSKNNMTSIVLHPRVSQVGLQKEDFDSIEQSIQTIRRGEVDKYIQPPSTDVIP